MMIAYALCLACLGPAPGGASGAMDQALFFASCAGRSAAVFHYQRFNTGVPTREAEVRRMQYDDLYAAVAPPQGPEADLLWQQRRRSQEAQERLLIQGEYHVDARTAARAEAEARRRLAQCDAALLG
ncbi:hypothetical protein [Aestuariicoccus sp. MJ-SS9]|uniref:hypothetical protein n=1 Tax=Aestuariicoccus sp. MJ-SS9 TaxID=3079855 RepID=UPI00290FA175|nr:hypothetical protein [Aestuariicoccus sp. MJ-SS9]MDU8911144.1 hypothetical protein [Aestuariicoccus sp. MJ-SS9]